MKSFQTATDIVTKFEQDFNVESWRIDDLHVWPLMRISFAAELLELSSIENTNKKSARHWAISIKSSLSTFLAKTRYALRPSSIASLVLALSCRNRPPVHTGCFTNDISREWTHKGFYQRFFDSLVDLRYINDLSSINFEYVSHGKTPSFRPFVDLSALYLIAKIKAAVMHYLRLRNVSHNIPFDNIYDWLESLNLPCSALRQQRLLKKYALLLEFRKLFLHLIRLYKLQRAIKVCWYSLDGMALAWACDDENIPCIDIQHGLAGSNNHRSYSRWTKFPQNGYKLMPSEFWVWSQQDAKAIQEWQVGLSPAPILKVIGNPWGKLAKDKSLYPYLFPLPPKLKNWADTNCLIIVVSLQTSELPPTVLQAIELSPKYLKWAIRAHPNFSSDVNNLKHVVETENISYKEASMSPLYALLSVSSVHITGWSAVYYDALFCNLKTIFFSSRALQNFNDEISTGQALYADSGTELLRQINSLLSLNNK